MAIVTVRNSVTTPIVASAGSIELIDQLSLADDSRFIVYSCKPTIYINSPLYVPLKPSDYYFFLEYSNSGNTPPGQDNDIVSASGTPFYNFETFRPDGSYCAGYRQPVYRCIIDGYVSNLALLARGFSIGDNVTIVMEVTIEFERVDKIQRDDEIRQLLKELKIE